ncbi:hypothetical protein DBIPINDM_008188 (plasmid) [Mesorhizobium sp. AR02]|uniref:hypothetical protein n=1 Tax=Mesorhizobium sp. AR02 TaxID=2865837 RepID=UPI00215F84A2|nr:hypothetical protein [Mesorhizobium sp. AR02]UVK57580.1 hypothetical protein DBIPINDM_008188 [Mesorhizobium sp. AR02]
MNDGGAIKPDIPPLRDVVAEAAQWLATGSADRGKAVVPQLQERFALPLKEAVEACRQAALIRARAT